MLVLMRCTLLCLALLLVACATQVEVKGHFPEPLRQPLPFSGALVLQERLQNATYRATHGQTIEVAIGAAQSEMFKTMVPYLFEKVQVSDELASALARRPDLTLVPELRDFQIATPDDTQLKIFEVWLRYLIQIYDREGQLLLGWPVAAYGKTQSQFMKSDEDALNQAAIVALRDAGARLVLEFESEPLIQRWMRQQQHRKNGGTNDDQEGQASREASSLHSPSTRPSSAGEH